MGAGKPIQTNFAIKKLAVILSCGILLTGCSVAAPENVNSVEAEPADSAPTVRREFPLDEYTNAINFGNLSEAEREALEEAINVKREDFLAQCMNDAGFEYIPNPTIMSGAEEFSGARLDDREWVTQWGWGLVNYPGRDNPAPSTSEVIDPNQNYYDGLSEAEELAWATAMYGVWDSETGEAEQLGCRSLADQHFYEETIAVTEEFRPLLDSIRQVAYVWTLSPEFEATHYDWGNCMADAGYVGLEHVSDAQTRFFEDYYNPFWDNWDWETSDQPYHSPELAELQEHEIEMALADLDCREKVNFQARQDQARYDAEAQFVADNRSALEALRSAMEQATTSVVNRVAD